MKSLKFDHRLALMVQAGEKTSTWRLYDDKDLSVNDEVRLIDKVDPERPETWNAFGTAVIHRVIQKRLGEILPEDMEGHEKFSSTEEMIAAYKKYYGNDVSDTTIVKLIFFTFKLVQQSNDVSTTSLFIKKLKVYADGGSRGNPGPSASGFVIVDPETDTVLVDKGVYLGVTTNNQAEYMALKFALEEAQKMKAQELDVYLDSMLVVNQMKGIFKVKNRDLWPVHDAIKLLISQFKRVDFTHVPRESNRLADAAVNRTLDEHLGGHIPADIAMTPPES